jgi:hypothetical protein
VFYSDFWESYRKVYPEGRHRTGGQGRRTGQPRGALELEELDFAPTAFALREEDAIVFEERVDARDLPATVLALLQSALLENNMK